jgi:carbamoyltransferase
MLIITMDASGDGVCATVSLAGDGRIERLHEIPSYHSLGELYSRVTQWLGMKPLEHEYKVMGLAPYAPPDLAERARRVFESYVRPTPDGLSFRNTAGAWGPGLLPRLTRDLAGVRFDAVAAGLQQRLEEVVVGFVLAWVRKTGVRSLGVAGGLFMNVKLNMLLSESADIDQIFLTPSGGDESLAYGAALLARVEACRADGREADPEPFASLYLGPEFSRQEILSDLEARRERLEWREHDDVESEIARRLAAGGIVGRLAGRMEWGARSLGARAILADPRDLSNVRRLNLAVKMRDFWMPFAPAILAERAADYLVNPRGLRAPYMINAFRSTPLAQREVVCGLHQFDLTCRPQIVEPSESPSFHRLIKAFEDLTGVGAVLNTSFNLHGEPIVCRPADAVHTLLNSGLDAVAIERFIVERAGGSTAQHA